MNDAELGAYLDRLVALGYMRTEVLPDGRINHVLTPEGEAGLATVQWFETHAIQSWLREVREIGG